MGRLTIKVPDVGEGVAEVELVSWAVAEGESVERNQVIAEVMTDKATVEVPSPADGVVGSLNGDVGDVMLVGATLFALEVEGGPDEEMDAEVDVEVDVEVAGAAEPDEADEAAAPMTAAERLAEPPLAESPVVGHAEPVAAGDAAIPSAVARGDVGPRPEGRKPTATPAVRRRAREAGIDLRTVVGTGPAGRISHEDLDAIFRLVPPASPDPRVEGGGGPGPGRAVVPNTDITDEPIVGIRRRIAEQMVASTSTIPHITYVEEVDMTALEELRRTLNRDSEGADPDRPKLTLLPFLIRALVNELPAFPAMNAHVIDQSRNGNDPSAEQARRPATLRTFGGIHVGVATQTDAGLVVPVVRHCETLNLWVTAARITELAEAARAGSAGPADLSGSTITITSLGPLGGLVTTPVINKPETTIVGVNKMATRPVWIDGEFVPRTMMNLSSSFDHRVIDGWDAARFVQALKRALEQPALLFVDRP